MIRSAKSTMLTERLLDEEALLRLDGDDMKVTQVAARKQALEKTQFCSLLCGICIGVFIQGSSLALNYLLHSAVNYQVYTFVALSWSILSGVLGVSVLLLTRSLLICVFYSTRGTKVDDAAWEAEKMLDELLSCMQKYYTIGAMAGLGTAWTVADYLLRIEAHMWPSLAIVFLALALYCAPSKYNIF